MDHGSLVAMLVFSICLAFVFGTLALKLRVSPLVGYLLAGVAVGPFTPGFVADQGLAIQLAEIGVILLMFGVGLHFSFKDLLSVWTIAVPGALIQLIVATLVGMGLARLFGWAWSEGFLFGLSLSVASTVVALRALQERRMVDTDDGHVTVGWLVVEDIAMVLVLVLVPAIQSALGGGEGIALVGGGDGIMATLLTSLGKVVAFVALMLVVGRRIIPWILHWVAHTGSRELFRLSVLSVALGVAFAAASLFGVSFALGAFFAGMILNESPLSQRAAEETLPLRDAFAVLFFVSVGMLFDPTIVVHAPLKLAATLAIVLIANPVVAYLVLRASGRSRSTALRIAVSLAQIGEFSFIVAGIGLELGLLPAMGRDLVLAAAIVSILLNPLGLAVVSRKWGQRTPKTDGAETESGEEPARDLVPTSLSGHTILIGYGRVGSLIGAGLKREGTPFLVIEDQDVPADMAKKDATEVLTGNASDPKVMEAANPTCARLMIVAIPQSFEAGQAVAQARRLNPDLEIVARAHSDDEIAHLLRCGANRTVMGEQEIALRILEIIEGREAKETEAVAV